MPYIINFNHNYQYVKNTVFFPEDITMNYRKGKRIVLGYLYHIHDNKAYWLFRPDGFKYFLTYIWPSMETINFPKPFDCNKDASYHYEHNAFNYNELFYEEHTKFNELDEDEHNEIEDEVCNM